MQKECPGEVVVQIRQETRKRLPSRGVKVKVKAAGYRGGILAWGQRPALCGAQSGPEVRGYRSALWLTLSSEARREGVQGAPTPGLTVGSPLLGRLQLLLQLLQPALRLHLLHQRQLLLKLGWPRGLILIPEAPAGPLRGHPGPGPRVRPPLVIHPGGQWGWVRPLSSPRPPTHPWLSLSAPQASPGSRGIPDISVSAPTPTRLTLF